MPLQKRKPFPLQEPPQDLDPDELVYRIRFTKEIFRDYQEYLNRLNLYRQRVWTCKFTGKTNLTYEEALVSEHHANEKVQRFPEELVAPVLRVIQYSILNLKDLTDEINTNLQENLCEGIELHGKNGRFVSACKIVKKLQKGDTIQCEVGWLDKDKNITSTSIVNTDDLIHKKTPFSRAVLKAFIRESTYRSTPWVVHDNLIKKYGIMIELPEELRDKFTIENGLFTCKSTFTDGNLKRKRTETDEGTDADETKRSGVKRVKYPIEDLLVKPAANDPVFTERPPLCTNFKVSMDCVGDLLMVWNFCSSFARLLNLWPFSLEDFENAICHKDSNLLLIVEAHSAILRFLIKDEGNYFFAIQNKKRELKVKMSTWKELLCDFLEMENRASFLQHVATIRRGHYGLLDTNVKISIFRELVGEALTTDAIRARLDDCFEQQQELAAKKRRETQNKKEEHLEKEEEYDRKKKRPVRSSENGNGSIDISSADASPKGPQSRKLKLSKRNSMHENGYHDPPYTKEHGAKGGSKRSSMHENGEGENVTLKAMMRSCKEETRKLKSANRSSLYENGESEHNTPSAKKLLVGCSRGEQGKRHKDKSSTEKQPETLSGQLDREIEKLSIRLNSLGRDRNYNRYWFFRRDERLFVESSDSKQWGYYATKEELDALIDSLNPKGVRERALKRQLEKQYLRISMALQKRTKDAAERALQEEADLRRSARVQAKPGDSAKAFLEYENRWKEKRFSKSPKKPKGRASRVKTIEPGTDDISTEAHNI